MSCDGCHTNFPDGWKEVKVGCVYRDYPQLGSAPSARTESIRYVTERENAKQFGLKLFALATQSGIGQLDTYNQNFTHLKLNNPIDTPRHLCYNKIFIKIEIGVTPRTEGAKTY